MKKDDIDLHDIFANLSGLFSELSENILENERKKAVESRGYFEKLIYTLAFELTEHKSRNVFIKNSDACKKYGKSNINKLLKNKQLRSYRCCDNTTLSLDDDTCIKVGKGIFYRVSEIEEGLIKENISFPEIRQLCNNISNRLNAFYSGNKLNKNI